MTIRALNPGFIVRFKLHRKLSGPGAVRPHFPAADDREITIPFISPYPHVPLPYLLIQYTEMSAASNERWGSLACFAACSLAPAGAGESRAYF